jgi:hypothetical protein
MDKKYQVFISSTYTDMKDERQAAVEAILAAGHIPAGMELFAASDKKQIEVIKGWIDRSDIFMLILGGRYGAVEPDTGKSYIQLEYEHAVSTGKPFFALYLTGGAINAKVKNLGADAIEQNDSKKLNEFRAQVKSRLCSEIEDVKDIKIHVPNAIRDLAAANKLEGWVRASNVPDLSPLMGQLSALQADNVSLRAYSDELKQHLGRVQAMSANGQHGLLPRYTSDFSESKLDAPLDLEITVDNAVGYASNRRVWSTTYLAMFSMIGAKLLAEPADASVQSYINKLLKETMQGALAVKVSEQSYQSLKLKLMALGVTDLKKPEHGALCWSLTQNGKALLVKIHNEE